MINFRSEPDTYDVVSADVSENRKEQVSEVVTAFPTMRGKKKHL